MEGDATTIECQTAASVEECMNMIMVCPRRIQSQLSSRQRAALDLTSDFF